MPVTGDLLERLSFGTDVDRREVLRVVSSLFLLRSGEHSDRELNLFSEILLGLMCGIDAEDLASTSFLMAPCVDTPKDVVSLLSKNEDIRISGPMLENSPVLSDESLAGLAAEAAQAQLLAMSRRTTLDATVSDILVARGDRAVLTEVARNRGAALSDAGLERLVDRGNGWAEVVCALVARPDVSAERLVAALGSLPPQVWSNFRMHVAQDATGAARILETALDHAALRRKREIGEVDRFVELVRDGTRTLDGCIDDLSKARRIEDLAALLSRLSGMSERDAMAALTQPNIFPLSILCRYIGVHDRTFLNLVRLRQEMNYSHNEDRNDATSNYSKLDKSTAERALRFHLMRSKFL